MTLRAAAFLLLGLLGGFSARAETHPWGEPFPGVVQDAKNVRGFVGDYKWLSNFFPCRVEYEGLVYRSSEGAYQSAKFPAGERAIYTTLEPDAAKALAHSKVVNAAWWDARKDQVMRNVVWAKFSQNPDLAGRLVATGDKFLEETNWWDDEYWGVYQGKGKNMLGQILMETRARLLATKTGMGKAAFSVCVFCGASDSCDPKFKDAARAIGQGIAQRGWTLVYGGGEHGLMGAVAHGTKENGGRVVEISPEFMKLTESGYKAVDEKLIVTTMSQRKSALQARSSAFVVLPGGLGTLDELADTLELKQLGQLDKPIVVFDQDGFYDGLFSFFSYCLDHKFSRPGGSQEYVTARSVGEVLSALEESQRSAPPL
jgi:uncharacterized protein (TIGR00730 family)